MHAAPAEYANHRSSVFPALIWPVAGILLFYIFMVRRFLLTETVPGDLGDARFTVSILEHAFQRIVDGNAAHGSPGMFYPFPGTLLLSDTHVGSAIFYAAFRYLGKTEFASFTLWVFTG